MDYWENERGSGKRAQPVAKGAICGEKVRKPGEKQLMHLVCLLYFTVSISVATQSKSYKGKLCVLPGSAVLIVASSFSFRHKMGWGGAVTGPKLFSSRSNRLAPTRVFFSLFGTVFLPKKTP
jgi:hypothetical protein